MTNSVECNMNESETKTGMSVEALSTLVEEKFHEMFHVYQRANGIPSGDISPMDALRMEKLKEEVVALIESVCDGASGYDDEREPEWDDGSSIGCKDCPDDECSGHCMSCPYRPI